MSFTLPNQKNKIWTQPNVSDVTGSLNATFNIDLLENFGKIRVGERLLVNTDNSDVSGLFCPVAFKYHAGRIYSLGGSTSDNGVVYSTSTSPELQSTYTADATSNAPADINSSYSDMVNGTNGRLYATSKDTLYECDSANAWSATTRSLATGSPHMLAAYRDRIYVSTVGGRIYSADIAGVMGALATSGAYTLQFTNTEENYITWIRSGSNRMWVGTINRLGGPGHIYSWDGVSIQPTSVYVLESAGALACVIKDDIPYVVDANSDLLVWNGGAFQKVAEFPKRNNRQMKNPISSANIRFIHPNGMAVVEGDIHVLINSENNDSTGSTDDIISSGVWVYNANNGLYHTHSLGLTKSGGTITEYGQAKISQVGAIAEIISPTDPTASRNGVMLVGATVGTDATPTLKHAIFYDDTNDTLQKAGYFITPQFETENVTDIWNKIILKFKRFLNSTDKIVVKSRTTESTPVTATITFVNTTSFTVLNSAVVVSNYWTEGTGGEVEFLQGTGAGRTAHITNAVNNAGTWTVTVDETITGATTQTAKARFANWNKVGTIQNQVEQWEELPVPDGDSTNIYIQFKIWMLFTGKNELHSLNIINTPQKKLN